MNKLGNNRKKRWFDWTDAQEDYLKISYFDYEAKDIGAIIGKSDSMVHKKAARMNLKKPTYHPNDKFFDIWSSDMAYVLGFIITDGCISNGRLSFGVQRKDSGVLDYISKLICPEIPVRLTETKRKGKIHLDARWRVGNVPHMIGQLSKLGICARKTGKEILPDCPEQFKSHLLRGIFDGDGCIHIHKNGQKKFSICSASFSFLQDCRINLGLELGKVHLREMNSKDFYNWFIYKQEDIRKLSDFMYTDNIFCLERKRIKFYV